MSAITGALSLGLCVGSLACRPLQTDAPRAAPITGSFGDPAPALFVPAAPPGGDWRPAETRAGELQTLIDALPPDGGLVVVSDVVDAPALARRVAEVSSVSAEPLNGDSQLLALPAQERISGLRERIVRGGIEVRHALLVEAGVSELDEGETRAAHIYGGCEAARARLGRAQEFGLMRLESFLDQADEYLAAVHSDALRSESDALEGLVAAAKESASCSEAVRSHAGELLACAETQAPCTWTPRLFLQARARVGRLAEAPDLALASQACSAELGAVLARADAATVAALPRLAVQWSELAARVATLGEIDAALRDGCAPRRRRFAPEAVDGLVARMQDIESALADSSASGEGGQAWLDALPEQAGWSAGEGSFHVPGLGPVVEVASFDAGPAAASTRVREAAPALGNAILSAGECVGRSGEAPARWSLIELDSGRLLAQGEVFAETLVCGDLELAL